VLFNYYAHTHTHAHTHKKQKKQTNTRAHKHTQTHTHKQTHRATHRDTHTHTHLKHSSEKMSHSPSKDKAAAWKLKRSDASQHEGISNQATRSTLSTRTHTHPNAEEKYSIKHVQTLSHAHDVLGMDMRPTEDMTAAILITGLFNGDVCIYRTPLSYTKPIHFQLLKRFHPHNDWVSAISIHPTKPLFITSSVDHKTKIWDLKEAAVPVLIKNIEQPDSVQSARYSPSGMLLTGCGDGVLRVYDVEPLCSLRWHYKFPGFFVRICSVAWSPSNHIACSFYSPRSGAAIRVWDSTFHTLFEHKQSSLQRGNYGLSFAWDDLLLCAGYDANTLYTYNISKSKVTTYRCAASVWAVTALSSEFVCVSCEDDMLRIYKVMPGCQLRFLTSLPCERFYSLASCVYPYKKDGGYVLASANFAKDVHISVTSRFNWYWTQEVTKITLNSKILPFCRDVHKIIMRYLG